MAVFDLNLPLLHADQVRCYDVMDPATGRAPRFKAVRCGRRWGKTEYLKFEASTAIANGQLVGWFAPSYKMIAEAFQELHENLAPICTRSDRQAGVMRFATRGRIDFWSLENEKAGRSRKYHLILIDEAAFTKENMLSTWQLALQPTLLDFGGSAIAASNTTGDDPDNFFWQLCNNPEHGFIEFHAPTHANPMLPRQYVDELESKQQPLVYKQEYLAQFVNWSGQAFFEEQKLLGTNPGGIILPRIPVPYPTYCRTVFATVDTAAKTGKTNDGTAVIYWAYSLPGMNENPLVILDWDVKQIEGDLLGQWLPGVNTRLTELANLCHAQLPPAGVFIEDKSTGITLLQSAKRLGQSVHGIDTKLTAMGKVERAISVSTYVYQGKVKFSAYAYNKQVTYKQNTRNHLLSQVLRFRVDDKTQGMEDDLLDCFTYGISIGLGDKRGI